MKTNSSKGLALLPLYTLRVGRSSGVFAQAGAQSTHSTRSSFLLGALCYPPSLHPFLVLFMLLFFYSLQLILALMPWRFSPSSRRTAATSACLQ